METITFIIIFILLASLFAWITIHDRKLNEKQNIVINVNMPHPQNSISTNAIESREALKSSKQEIPIEEPRIKRSWKDAKVTDSFG